MDGPDRPLAYLEIASLASSGDRSIAAQASSKVITPLPPSVHWTAVRFWSSSTFRGGVLALAHMAVRRRMEQHNAR